MKITTYTHHSIQRPVAHPATIQKTAPAAPASEAAAVPSWSIGTEDTISIAAFVLALVFIVFLGIGWLMDKATTTQFIYACTGTVSAFTAAITGFAKANKAEKEGRKSNTLAIIQWILILFAVLVAGLALYRAL